MVTHSSILTWTSLLTLLPMFTRRTQVFTESSSVPWRALAFSSDVVTGGSILALAFLLASVPIGAHLTLSLTAPPSVPRGADTGSSDGVAQCSVLALTSVAAVGPPVVTVTSTGAVGPPPAGLTLAGVGGHATAMDTALCTMRGTDLSVLVEARAALGFPPIHGFLSSTIRRPIAYPVSGALEPVEDVSAAGVINLIKRMGVRLLHRH